MKATKAKTVVAAVAIRFGGELGDIVGYFRTGLSGSRKIYFF